MGTLSKDITLVARCPGYECVVHTIISYHGIGERMACLRECDVMRASMYQYCCTGRSLYVAWIRLHVCLTISSQMHRLMLVAISSMRSKSTCACISAARTLDLENNVLA